MFIDLEGFEFGGPDIDQTMRLCGPCGQVYAGVPACPTCGSTGVPFLDRRPLLLSAETYQAVEARIDELGALLGDMDDEETEFILNELGPYLSRMMDESRVAQGRRDAGYAYRETHLNSADVLALAERMCTLPTKLLR